MTEPASHSQVQGVERPLVAPARAGSGLTRHARPAGLPGVAVAPRPRVPHAVKRALDYLLASVGLVLVLPLFAAIAVLIKLNSPGPVFFFQERVGRGGRGFRLIKFRTMYHGVSDHVHREFMRRQLAGDPAVAGNGDGNSKGVGSYTGDGNGNGDGAERPMYKLVFDERVTSVGRVLRRTSLDELPQVLNVLRGEMSLVGPRPPLRYELDSYEPWQFERLSVIPGITGLWQVSGRNLLSYRQMCEIDATYVRGWSLWLDFKILLRTVPVVLFHTGWTA